VGREGFPRDGGYDGRREMPERAVHVRQRIGLYCCTSSALAERSLGAIKDTVERISCCW
jgi:hypothetical protein